MSNKEICILYKVVRRIKPTLTTLVKEQKIQTAHNWLKRINAKLKTKQISRTLEDIKILTRNITMNRIVIG